MTIICITFHNCCPTPNTCFAAESHRAKIPAMIMGRVRLSDVEMDNRAYRKYVFNAEEGECHWHRIQPLSFDPLLLLHLSFQLQSISYASNDKNKTVFMKYIPILFGRGGP